MTNPAPIGLKPAFSLAAKPTDPAGLKKAAQQFEAIFLRQMISSMRSASLGEDMLGSTAGDQFRDMADARTADSMAEKGSLGIAEMLMRQFGAKEATPPATAVHPTAPKAAPDPAVDTGQ